LLALEILQAEPVRSRLYAYSSDDTLRAYVTLALEHEREGNYEAAAETYTAGATTGDPLVREFARDRLKIVHQQQAIPESPKDSKSVPLAIPFPITRPSTTQSSQTPAENARKVSGIAHRSADVWSATLTRIGSYAQRLAPANIAALRDANRQGATSFGTPAEESTGKGMVLMLWSALGHTLFSPFPWSVFMPTGPTGFIRHFALVELLWVYPVVLFGLIGMAKAIRSAAPDRALIAIYVLARIAAPAIAVPNDGLLLRYRLQFLVPLPVFVPTALTGSSASRLAHGLPQRVAF